ncbi:17802_t:CDS:2 [Racocetra fulgida]|uniref:17802_t:CDS:1 n=1 Tax=Racocetra fulgida TaxID=60492 RepID=A0A9N8Z132_9GLOM|nr:17802_t:CDS:2 [Racocetra fulgida]
MKELEQADSFLPRNVHPSPAVSSPTRGTRKVSDINPPLLKLEYFCLEI